MADTKRYTLHHGRLSWVDIPPLFRVVGMTIVSITPLFEEKNQMKTNQIAENKFIKKKLIQNCWVKILVKSGFNNFRVFNMDIYLVILMELLLHTQTIYI